MHRKFLARALLIAALQPLVACRPPSISANLEDLEDSPHAFGRLNLANLALGDVLLIDHQKKTYGRYSSIKQAKKEQVEQIVAGTTSVALGQHVTVDVSGGTPRARAWLRSTAAKYFFLSLDLDRQESLPTADIELNQMFSAAKNRTDLPPTRNTNTILALHQDMEQHFKDGPRYSFAIVSSVTYGTQASIRHDQLAAAAAHAGVKLVDAAVDVEAGSYHHYTRTGTDLPLLYGLTGLKLDPVDRDSPFRIDMGDSISWSGYRRVR